MAEAGVHRVQRVSPTDSRGRVHTSAATVAVLEEPAEVDEVLDPKDVEIEVFHSQGPGGQNVNKVETGVRARHLPTGLTATSQTRSQGRNREEALRVLAARVAAGKRQALEEEVSGARRAQLGSGDRSQKMRTYDFPEGIVVDHRRGLRSGRLQEVLDGALELLRAKAPQAPVA